MASALTRLGCCPEEECSKYGNLHDLSLPMFRIDPTAEAKLLSGKGSFKDDFEFVIKGYCKPRPWLHTAGKVFVRQAIG